MIPILHNKENSDYTYSAGWYPQGLSFISLFTLLVPW